MSQGHLTMQFQTKISNFIIILLIYTLVYFVGIITYLKLLNLNYIVDFDSNSYVNSLYLFFSILIFSSILLIVIRYFKKLNIIAIVEILLSSLAIFMFSNLFLGIFNSLLVVVFVMLLRDLIRRDSIRNLITSIISGFIGGYMAYTFGIFPIILLLILLSLYDFFSVFKSSHMIEIANNVSNTSFLYSINNLKIGSGDLILPSIFFIKMTFEIFSLGVMSFILVFLILVFTIYLIDILKRELPALPMQCLALLFIYVLYFFIK